MEAICGAASRDYILLASLLIFAFQTRARLPVSLCFLFCCRQRDRKCSLISDCSRGLLYRAPEASWCNIMRQKLPEALCVIPGHASQIWASLQIRELNTFGDPAFLVHLSGPLSRYEVILETGSVCLSVVLALSLPPTWWGSHSVLVPGNSHRGHKTTGRFPKGPKGLQHSPGKKAVIMSRRR